MRIIDLELANCEAIRDYHDVSWNGHLAEAETEQFGATLVTSGSNTVQGAAVAASLTHQPRHIQVFPALIVQPTLVQASAVCATAGSCLIFAQRSGRNLYDAWNLAPPNLTVITIGAALIMGVPLLVPALRGRVSPVRLAVMTGIATLSGCGMLEWAVLHLPIASPAAAAETFIRGNLLVLVCAVMVGLVSAWRAWQDAEAPQNTLRLQALPWEWEGGLLPNGARGIYVDRGKPHAV